MTVTIPAHLAHLRTDRRGLPVPYVNRWGPGEDKVELLTLAVDRHVDGRMGVFYDDSAEEVPDFLRQNLQRQRECMTRGLCQVCARHVPWSRRFLVVAGMSVESIDFRGLKTPVVTEPWLCQRCAEFAIGVCPALIRRTREEKLELVPVTSKRQVQQVVSSGWVEGPWEETSRRVQPAMWVKLLLKHVRLVADGALERAS